MDESKENRVAGAVGSMCVPATISLKSKTVVVAAGGASNIFKPRSVGEGAAASGTLPGRRGLLTA